VIDLSPAREFVLGPTQGPSPRGDPLSKRHAPGL
jgi:hypothetical protein